MFFFTSSQKITSPFLIPDILTPLRDILHPFTNHTLILTLLHYLASFSITYTPSSLYTYILSHMMPSFPHLFTNHSPSLSYKPIFRSPHFIANTSSSLPTPNRNDPHYPSNYHCYPSNGPRYPPTATTIPPTTITTLLTSQNYPGATAAIYHSPCFCNDHSRPRSQVRNALVAKGIAGETFMRRLQTLTMYGRD